MRDLDDYLPADFLQSVLYTMALSHRSQGKSNNERLEFLGDAVLGLIVSNYLYHTFGGKQEGVLSRMRSHLVQRETLAKISRHIGIDRNLLFSKTVARASSGMLSDALEALIGALFLAKGMQSVQAFVYAIFKQAFSELGDSHTYKDSKTLLQEYLQAKRLALPHYLLKSHVIGRNNSVMFVVACKIEALGIEVLAEGKTKALAEQSAAKMAIYAVSR